MHLFGIGCVVITLSCLPTPLALSTSCKEDWKIDWDQEPPDWSSFRLLSNPGEILPNITLNDTLQFVGVLWSAPSWQEITGRLCVQFGPMIYAFYPVEQFRTECDKLVASLQKGEKSDIYGMCTSLWDQFEVENKTREIVTDHDPCRESATDIPRYVQVVCDVEPLETVYAKNFIEKSSRFAFDLLEWLGPSPFSGDFFGVCSAGRILLNTGIDQIVDEVTNLLTYLVADSLEYMNRIDSCTNSGTFQDISYRLPLSIQDGERICDFLSRNPSQKEYLEKGAALIDNFLNVFVDEGLCIDILAFMTSYDDQYGTTGYEITGMNLTSESHQSKFCSKMASAFSDSSQYSPAPYSFPRDQDITNLELYDEDGQVLPNFSFMDAMDLLGAFYRSNTLLDGGVLLCDIFESFLSSYKPSFPNICPILREGDTAALEKICLQESLPTGYHPSLRIPTMIYMTVTLVDMGRKYFNLAEVSRDFVCSALDDFYTSKNNLGSFVRLGVDVFLAELLPIADNICKDYDSVIDLLRNSSSQPSDKFEEFVQVFTDLILTHLGFSDQQKFCQAIAAGIDTSSGRTKNSLVKFTQEQLLVFLTDNERCQKSTKSVQRTFEVLSSENDFSIILNQYTGYNSSTSLCEDFSAFFDPALCQDPETNPRSAVVTNKFNGLLIVLSVLMIYLLHVL